MLEVRCTVDIPRTFHATTIVQYRITAAAATTLIEDITAAMRTVQHTVAPTRITAKRTLPPLCLDGARDVYYGWVELNPLQHFQRAQIMDLHLVH